MPTAYSLEPRADVERGIALLIVVSVLTVIVIMGAAFLFSMNLETKETLQFVSTSRARYAAETGVAYARALLDEDALASSQDDLTEGWATYPQGGDADTDGDQIADARWWVLTDAGGEAVGRYALGITDEAGRANLNAAYADAAAVPPGAISFVSLLEQSGLSGSRAQQAAEAVERYRHGPDERPGQAGLDDDGDGAIDEADEYQPLALRGDDRRLEALEELITVAGLDAPTLRRLSRLATVHSWDLNVSAAGTARINVNTATAEELLAALLEAGVADPWQTAVNMADFVDADLELSRVMKASQVVGISDQGPLGGWAWRQEPTGHYASDLAGGSPLVWTVAVPTGSFQVLVRGLDGVKVGDVTIAGQLKPSMNSDESLGRFDLDGTLEVRVAHREPAGAVCAFRGIELVSEEAEAGVMVRGIEAVRFNELMVEPVMPFEATAATFDSQGSDWGCPVGSAVCTISGVGQGRWSWTSPALPPGRYYVRVFGAASGQTVGEVRIDGNTQRLLHGQAHPSTVLIGPDRKITLTIGKTASEGTYYFKSAALSLQPDGEYVELINLSDADIDVGGWTIEGELTGGRTARLPAGSTVKAHGLLVAAVDLDDAQPALGSNGISARSAWEIATADAVQLEFPGGVPSRDDDWLKVALPSGSARRLMLRSAGVAVEEVEYPLPLPTTSGFQSLEKGDPSVVLDADGNGLDDGWYPSLRLYTPGVANENDGLRETVDFTTIMHDPQAEVSVLNRPLGGVGELAGLPSGQAWKPFASADLANIVDRLTVEGYRLEAEGRLVEELGGERAWQEKSGGYYEHTDPAKAEVIGRWRWTDLVDGHYRVSLYGWPGEQMSVRWEQADGSFTSWSPALSTDAQGRLVIGRLAVGMQQTPSMRLTLDVSCASLSGVCHVDHLRLDPRLIRVGPVNINTAPQEVLLALPGMTQARVSRVIAGRPYGDQDGKSRGIGDLLIGDALAADEEEKLSVFRGVAHLLTTRSSIFQILSLAQALDGDRALASQRVQTIVER